VGVSTMKFRDRLASVLKEVGGDPTQVHEIEIRLGYKDGNSFVPNIGRNNYTKIVQCLDTNKNWNCVKTQQHVDYFCNRRNARLTVENGKETSCICKTRKQVWDFPNFNGTNWGIRLSWCIETPFPMEEFGDNADYSRDKSRMRFEHRNAYGMSWYYDATIVQTKDDDIRDKDADMGNHMYEFELEVNTEKVTDMDYLAHSTELKVLDVVDIVSKC